MSSSDSRRSRSAKAKAFDDAHLHPFDDNEAPMEEEDGGFGDWSRSCSRSRSPSTRALEHELGELPDVEMQKHEASDEGRPSKKFKELDVGVPEGVIALGFSVTPVMQGWRDIAINKVTEGSWAELKGLKVGDEILALNGQDVLAMDTRLFVEAMSQRPLNIRVLSGPVYEKIEELVQHRSASITNASQLAPECENLQLVSLCRYEYVYMFRSANLILKLPNKVLPRQNHGTKALLVASEFFITSPFHELVMEVEEIMNHMSNFKEAGNLTDFLEASQRLPKGFWGTWSQDQVKKFFKWPVGPFDVNAKNVDFQFNLGLVKEHDPDNDGSRRIRLVRHFFNLPAMGRNELVQLAGDKAYASSLDWEALGDYRTTGHQVLQLVISRHLGGVTFQSKTLRPAKCKVVSEIAAPNVDVDALMIWLKEAGDADVDDRSVFETFYFKEMLKPDSNLKTLKTMGMSKETMKACIIDSQTKGSKGSAEVLSWDLTFEDFDLERLPWLKNLIEHFGRDRTQGPVLVGPRKCGKTQLLMTLMFHISATDKQAKVAEGVVGADEWPVGLIVSNACDNFSRSLRSKRNLPQLLDDPNLTLWKQADWLAWLDLVAVGATSSTRFQNVAMTGFRAIGSNKKMQELFLNSHGHSMSEGEVDAIKNKGLFVDLWDTSKLQQMRKSTWYRDTVTGQPVPIMLTIEGERKVRQRFGLSCEVPDPVAESSPERFPSPPTRPIAMNMELSPSTFQSLETALGSASASSSSGILLSAASCNKLRAAMQKIGGPCGDCLAEDA
jgi:hypothetical protein